MKKLYVVGLGPGDEQNMTGRARAALEESEVIVGYTAYVDLIRARYPEKAFLATAMRGEVERCRMALEAACGGRTVAVVSSGDAGVYGMAGLVYELAQGYDPIDIEVVPGVTAACSGAALLGAPLIHDFAVISLSDLLTPWELIERRLDAAGRADFCICLYHPACRRRAGNLRRACDILRRSRAPETV
ncbi:precorrin-3B C(17)-methyltransferase, partial [uncultured Anaerotruncus sp.]|uniref:precorrin-3B C(17)-methyltransferase n=1 Tax=uncultured Anaerotruncus sp. TaxID=905011 RepID=UPI002673E3CB